MTVRTRFAPSPTGSLHVGGARTALYCLLMARNAQGQFLLRIEDTDRKRSTEEAAEGIIRDMKWLGLHWDEGPGTENSDVGPFFQSQRLELYHKYMNQLIESGHAYEAWETTEELGAMRDAAMADKRNFRYRQVHYTPEQISRFKAEGRTPILRFKAPNHDIVIADEVLGNVRVAAEDLEDIVIRKADGFPTYHFAVVIDDHHMGITHILRGQEHLMNTPKHLGLYEALGWEPPRNAHLPLIFNPNGSKMSKRDKAKAARAAARDAAKDRGTKTYEWLAEAISWDLDELNQFMKKKYDGVKLAEAIGAYLGVDLPMIEVMDFRKGGYLPEALNNYLALLGWSPGNDLEFMDLQTMSEKFSTDRVNKTAAKFDTVKLTSMNGEYIRQATPERLMEAFQDWLQITGESHFKDVAPERLALFLELYRPRMSTLADLDKQAAFFFEAPTGYDPKAAKKFILKGGGLERLPELAEAVGAVSDWTVEGIESSLKAWAEARELGMGKIAQPLRIALTGTSVSPGIFETLALMDKDEVVRRIEACHAALA